MSRRQLHRPRRDPRALLDRHRQAGGPQLEIQAAFVTAAGFDRHQIDLVETAKQRAKNGTAVIAVLHDLNLAMRFADRIVLLHHGRLAVDGGRAETITAETIRRIFEVDVTIDYTAGGVPFLLPQTMRPASTT